MNGGTADVLIQFRDAIAAAGLPLPETIEADGALHRFSTNGKRGDDSGWYILHPDGIPAGAFGCWREEINQTWRADLGHKLTNAEKRAHRAKVAAMRKAREAEERRGHQAAAAKAEAIWNAATLAPVTHPYLTRKGIAPHDTRVADDGRLLVPMYDVDGKLWNLERIAPEKPPGGGPDKKGLYRGKRTGCCFTFGTIEESPVLCLCEGFATGASIHEATGYPVAVAFNAGNLQPVATALRRKWPDLPIILCADNDLDTEAKGKGNPGMTKAKEAAKATGGLVALPEFGPERPAGATDWNDLHRAHGLEAVKQQIERVTASAGIEQSKPNDPPTPAAFLPPEDKRSCYQILDDWHESDGRRYRPGVYSCTVKKQRGGTATLVNTWVCSPLHVDAITFDEQHDNFGRLLRFKTTLGKWREWAMPMELLKGNGEELRGALLAMGVHLDPNQAPRKLPDYLSRCTPKRQMHCALQTGWVKPSAFVLPDAVIGPDAAGVTFQSLERGHAEYTTVGTLDGWRADIATRAIGNPLLMLALSAGFAGPLLHLVQNEGGGKTKTGQIVWLMDVPVARTFGVWDTLHDLPDGATLSNAIKQAAKTHYGHPGRAFLERLTKDNRNWRTLLEQVKGLFDPGDEGQVIRVAERFALYGMASTLATEYGLTGWPAGEALKAAGEGFRLWLSEHGLGNDEQRQIQEQVSDFIARHGDARFSNGDISPADRGPLVRDRAGWWKDANGERTYLFNSQGLREALTGFDFKRGLDVLQATGMLLSPAKPDGKRSRPTRIAGHPKTIRLYPITLKDHEG